MKSRTWLALAWLLAGLPGAQSSCTKYALEPTETPPRRCPKPLPLPPAPEAVDILFVVDNSPSMASKQEKLQAQFKRFIDVLRHRRGGLPSLHLGVVTTDLGTGTYTNIPGCTRLGGDKGILGQAGAENRGDTAIGPGQHYIVDVAPQGCRIQRRYLETGVECLEHDCTQENCDLARAPGSSQRLTLSIDQETGCPRCRNYQGDLADVLAAYADVGDQGCGFEQPLEAMKKALDRQDPDAAVANWGFFRDDSFLAVVFVTDEDDCSASKPEVLFDPDESQNRLDSALGPMTSYRCFEFGITCDTDDRTVQGPRSDCVPRRADDPLNLLHPVNRYTAFLEGLKDPNLLLVAAVAGPVPDRVTVTRDDLGRPKVAFSCQDPEDPDQGAAPAIRLQALVGYFNSEGDLQEWAFTSICSQDFSSVSSAIAHRIADRTTDPCWKDPIAGCPNGPLGTECSPCYPRCRVTAVSYPRTPGETAKKIHWCGEVCQGGLCKPEDLEPCLYAPGSKKCTCRDGLSPTVLPDGNGNLMEGCAPLRYPHPDSEAACDPTLAFLSKNDPEAAPACWYVSANPNCSPSGQNVPARALVNIVWAEAPPSGTSIRIECETVPLKEGNCHDGLDNDQDCKTDEEDEDCRL